jgi:hypothetical protein
MYRLILYKQSDSLCNNASIITSMYHNSQLQMCTSHVATPPNPGDLREYHMTQVNTWGLTGNLEACRDGLRA